MLGPFLHFHSALCFKVTSLKSLNSVEHFVHKFSLFRLYLLCLLSISKLNIFGPFPCKLRRQSDNLWSSRNPGHFTHTNCTFIQQIQRRTYPGSLKTAQDLPKGDDFTRRIIPAPPLDRVVEVKIRRSSSSQK